MPRNSRQKLKLLYLKDYLLKNTDETHAVTVKNMIEYLESCGVAAERKSVYDDLETLAESGMDILSEKRDRNTWYYVASRDFEISELKLLVDAVLGSRFITERKSAELIRKIESLCSRYEAYALDRQLTVAGRIKAMNESIYYTVDAIHNAISENKKIRFQYFQWNVKKQMELRHDGAYYQISPWGLSWHDDNYYLVGYDSKAGKIKHYRVDKMLHIQMCDETREGKEHFKKLDMAEYAKKSFGMFGGKECQVKLLVDNALAGVIIDRFGKDVMLVPVDEERFTVNVKVYVSGQFLGWIISLGEGVKVVGPDDVVEMMKEEIKRLTRQYV